MNEESEIEIPRSPEMLRSVERPMAIIDSNDLIGMHNSSLLERMVTKSECVCQRLLTVRRGANETMMVQSSS